MPDGLSFRWLGVQALELVCAGCTLWIDPFFTRPPWWRLAGTVQSNEVLSSRLAPQADFILVTHPHYDHLMDVPAIARRTGALVCGSPNTGGLLAVHGISPRQFRQVSEGDRLELGPFAVEVLPSRHISIPPLDWVVNGPLSARSRRSAPSALAPRDYRMDFNLGFFVQAAGLRILACPGPARPCDLLFCSTQRPLDYLRGLFGSARARLFVPLHWDDFFRPLDRPLRELGYPGTPRLAQVHRTLQAASPETRWVLPVVGDTCRPADLLPGW